MAKKIAFILSVFALTLAFGYFILAWTEPSQAPPSGNVSAPLNTGSVGQEKQGGLILNTGGATTGLIVDKGKMSIGTVSPSGILTIQQEGAEIVIGEQAGTRKYAGRIWWDGVNPPNNNRMEFGQYYDGVYYPNFYFKMGSNDTIFNGKVGVGAASPSEKLTVSGNISATGRISAPNISATEILSLPVGITYAPDGTKCPIRREIPRTFTGDLKSYVAGATSGFDAANKLCQGEFGSGWKAVSSQGNGVDTTNKCDYYPDGYYNFGYTWLNTSSGNQLKVQGVAFGAGCAQSPYLPSGYSWIVENDSEDNYDCNNWTSASAIKRGYITKLDSCYSVIPPSNQNQTCDREASLICERFW